MSQRIFFCDGACSTNGTWAGGYGVVELSTAYSQTIDNLEPKYSLNFYKSEYCENTTNNREELKAMIEVFKQIEKYPAEDTFSIYSDSAYVVNMCNQWIWNWCKNGWQNNKKVTVENVDLVKELYNYLNKNFHKCQILKVKGHNGELGNELADALAANDSKKLKSLIEINNIAYDTLCYCPICDKEQLVIIFGNKGHCPICKHHINN